MLNKKLLFIFCAVQIFISDAFTKGSFSTKIIKIKIFQSRNEFQDEEKVSPFNILRRLSKLENSVDKLENSVEKISEQLSKNKESMRVELFIAQLPVYAMLILMLMKQ